MGKKDKLLAKLLSKPKDFTFNELETIVIKLHKPHHQKVLLPYQIREVISKLEKGGII